MGDPDERPPGGGGHGRVPWGVWGFFIAMMVWAAVYLVLYWDINPRARGRMPPDAPPGEPIVQVDRWAQMARIRDKVPPEERGRRNPLPPTVDAFDRGRTIYFESCAVCHGEAGNARTPAALAMSPPPVDFTHPAFAEMQPGETFYIIAQGSVGTGMPPFRNVLSDEDVWAVVRYLQEAFVQGQHGQAGEERSP